MEAIIDCFVEAIILQTTKQRASEKAPSKRGQVPGKESGLPVAGIQALRCRTSRDAQEGRGHRVICCSISQLSLRLVRGYNINVMIHVAVSCCVFVGEKFSLTDLISCVQEERSCHTLSGVRRQR